MKLTGSNKKIKIDNTHEAFKNTPYEKEKWSVTIDNSFDNLIEASLFANKKAESKFDKEKEADLYQNAVNGYVVAKYGLLCAIVDWDGFNDENDKPLSCSMENKEKFFNDRFFDRFFTILNEIRNDDTVGLTDKELEAKKD